MGYRGNEADAVMSFDGATQVASQVYMGPKELDLLEAVNPALSKAIDFGLWGMIALPFLRALRCSTGLRLITGLLSSCSRW